MGWKAFAQCGIYMVEYEMLENSSGYTDKYKICKSITYKEGIKKGGTQAMKILVTGGAGYIGSHTCVELLEAGYDVVIVDNLYNASEKAVDRIGQITGKTPTFYEADIRDYEKMTEIFAKEQPDTVIHFAGLKAVGESVRKPLEYYENNIAGTLNLCKVMRENGCKNIIFSSSATVYGNPAFIPITEECPKGVCTNPYGWTKHMLEQILTDIQFADPEWNVILLRYFNPIGAHKSGLIGEDPKGIPNNLLPYVAQVAIGKLPCVGVFGNDYDTPDGTGPFVSSKIAIGSPSSARSFLTMSIRFFCSSCVPCEKFSLATFIPASISFRSTSSLSVAGPSVQTIFVFLITYYLVLYLFAKSSPILTYTPSIIAYVKIYNHISKVFLS